MKNYDIVQVPHAFSFVLGFYGMCNGASSNAECAEYDMNFSEFRKVVDSVYEVSSSQSGTTFSWYKSALFGSDFNHFTKLECGKTYYFVIKPGVGRLTIPHLYVSNSLKKDELKGRIVESCELIDPTPTPESDCCDSFGNALITTGSSVGSESLNGVKSFGFQYGGRICFDNLELTFYPSRFNFKTEDESIKGYITTMGSFKNKSIRYTDPDGICYIGVAETQNGFNILTKR